MADMVQCCKLELECLKSDQNLLSSRITVNFQGNVSYF